MGFLNYEGTNIPLGNIFTIGSGQECNVIIQGDKIAPRHARLENKDDGYYIRDLKSAYGFYLNDSKTQGDTLKEGDEIFIGDHHFIFTYSENFKKGLGLESKNIRWNNQLKALGQVAKSEFPVLILGPSGTGKEVIANALHKKSRRGHMSLVSVNCSALTETLIESELFGHVRGSFTGAIQDRKGAFEEARGGTLFLDEIGDLSFNLQAKLLRALENNEIRPVGSDKVIKTNVRIIAATHQNLLQKIKNGQFRSDLYFRLNVVSVKTPTLKERIEDFENLLHEFGKKYRLRFSATAIKRLKYYSWPGNIRELKNTVARAATFYPHSEINEDQVDFILDKDLIEDTTIYEATGLPVMKELEKQMIVKRLTANEGNQRKTALELGIPKSTLNDRLRLYNIDPLEFKFKTPHVNSYRF